MGSWDKAGEQLKEDFQYYLLLGLRPRLPRITSADLASDNSTLAINFSQGVYADIDKIGALTPADFVLLFDDHGGVPLTVSIDSVTHVAGEKSAVLNLTVTGIPLGVETIEVRPADGSTIFNASNGAMPASSTTGEINFSTLCNNDNTLSALTTDSGTWDAPYDVATSAYNVDVPSTETDLVVDTAAVALPSTIEITDPNGTTNGTGTASRTVTLNPAGMTTAVTVQVTSECGTPSGTIYTLTVQRADPDVTLSGGGIYDESAGTVDLTVALSAESGLPVTVDLGYSGALSTPGDYTTSHPVSITIPAGSLMGMVTLTIVDDAIDEPNESLVVDITGVTNGIDPAPGEQEIVSITDNDSAGITVNPTTADVTEGGATDTFEVVLNTQPTGDVVIDIANTADATVDLSTLTFTTLNWSTPQTVTVTAVDDSIDETSPESTTLVLTMNGATADAIYAALNPDDVVVSVTDNDTAGITVNPTTADVTEGGATDTFDVVLDTQPTGDVVIDIANTADATVDKNAITFTTANWSTAQTITVSAVDDSTEEGTEVTTLVLSMNASTADSNYLAINPDDVDVTVTDNDIPTITLSIVGTGNINETGGIGKIRATLSKTSSQPVTVNFSFGGTATESGAGQDYTKSGSPLVIPAGSLTGDLTITSVSDTDDEPNETIIVGIASAINATPAGTSQTITIVDDDGPTVTLSVGSGTVSEGNSTTVTATLSSTTTQDVTVNLGYSGIASYGSDYTVATSIVISAGSLSNSITLNVLADSNYEQAETIIIDVTSVINASENGTQQQTITIPANGSQPTVTLSVDNANIAENGGVATITATLSGTSYQTVTVNLGYTGTATDTTDYNRSGTTITLYPGYIAGNVTVTAVQDAMYEGSTSETVIVDITGVTNGTESGTQQQTVTIVEDDLIPTVRLSVSAATIAEATSSSSTITATLSNGYYQDVTVNLGYGGTATNGGINRDFNPNPGTTSITITAGNLTGTATVTARNDGTNGEGNESIIISITSVAPVEVTTAGSPVIVVIIDNDTAPARTVTLSGGGVNIVENGGSTLLTATLSSTAGTDIIVVLSYAGTAAYGTDYTAPETITIPAGNLAGTGTITASDDSSDESNETVIASILGANLATVAGVAQTVTVLDDDSLPTVTLSGGTTITKPDGVATITATLSSASGLTVTVNLGYTGTATLTTDYTVSGNSIVIPAGSLNGSVTITSVSDAGCEFDNNETVIVDITGVTNGTEDGTQQQTVTITDTTAPAIYSAATMDADGDGLIDHYKITFNTCVDDSTFPGYVLNGIGSAQTQWLVYGHNNVVLKNGAAAPETDTADDNIIYIGFKEGGLFDTDDKPDLTTASLPGLADLYGNTIAQVSTASVSEADGAAPVITRFHGATGQRYAYVDFSEPVDADGGTCDAILTRNDFTYYDDVSGGAASIRNAGWLDDDGCDQQINIRLNANIASADTTTPFDKLSAVAGQVYDAANNTALDTKLVNLDDDYADADTDGVADTTDNCPYDFNPGQTVTSPNPGIRGDACYFEYSATIDIDATGLGLGGDVNDYPVLVRLGDTESAIISDVQDGAPDIRFIYQSTTEPGPGQSVYCPYEIERWDADSNRAEIWVLVPTVYSGSTSYIKMWYNDGIDGTVSDRQDSTAVFSTSNNFTGVWHMNQDPSGGTGAIIDSTDNSHDGTSSGVLAADDLVESLVGEGIFFDGSLESYIDCGSVDVSDTDAITLEAWGYYAPTTYWWRGFIGQNNGQNNADYGIDVSDSGELRTWVGTNQWTPGQAYSYNSWFHVAFTYRYNGGGGSGNSWRYLYYNGALVYSIRNIDVQITNTAGRTFKIGDNWDPDYAWYGIIDEVRVSNSERSADWINLNYETQKEDQTVVTVSQP